MKPKYLKIAAIALAAMMTLNGCQEHIDEGARYTFVGNTIATYLQEQDECSHFVEILTRGGEIGLMKAYGQYTCFAPTNEAVERFLKEQADIYKESVEANKLDPKVKVINTGIKSPELNELSDSMCKVISRNHILPAMYLGIDLKGNSIPEANMNERDLVLGIDTLTGRYVVDKTAPIKSEEEVENGVVHIVEGIINPSSMDVPTVLDGYPYFSIFNEALKETKLADALTETEDKYYTDGDKIVESIRPKEFAPYPAKRRFGFTIFLETDETLGKHGITDLKSLEDKCKEFYPAGTDVWVLDAKTNKWVLEKIDHNTDDYTDWHHPVKQFVAYHLIDRKVMYENLVCHKIELKGAGTYDSELDFQSNVERTEYYVTMNNRILKVTMPLGAEKERIYLNYAPEGKGQNILVHSPNDFTKDARYKEYKQEALNGSLNVINDVLFYDVRTMKDQVLNGIMRFDFSSICSELTNNRIRWKYASTLTDDGAVFIPHKYCDKIEVYTDNTRLYYLAPHTEWHNYQGDEMMAQGLFDFAYQLPPVPEGTYEIRMGYSASVYRGIAQVYLDNQVTGIPIDLTILGKDPRIGWKPDKGTDNGGMNGDEELIVANDKDMKNRGYLKGPSTFNGNEGDPARDTEICLRVVIATRYLTEGAHWLRFKNVNVKNPEQAQFMHDYLEIVPTDYLRREDISAKDKRK